MKKAVLHGCKRLLLAIWNDNEKVGLKANYTKRNISSELCCTSQTLYQQEKTSHDDENVQDRLDEDLKTYWSHESNLAISSTEQRTCNGIARFQFAQISLHNIPYFSNYTTSCSWNESLQCCRSPCENVNYGARKDGETQDLKQRVNEAMKSPDCNLYWKLQKKGIKK